jgi:putative SOS response-associated peptidase YedK
MGRAMTVGNQTSAATDKLRDAVLRLHAAGEACQFAERALDDARAAEATADRMYRRAVYEFRCAALGIEAVPE